MIDNRIYTFLELCEVMNYHKTAENLNMTQPGVTQHIKFLEDFYACTLFNYSNKKLSKTNKAMELEKYARNIISLNACAKEDLLQKDAVQINIGATKTIGEYLLNDAIASLVLNNTYELNIIIDNTENLLHKLNHFQLDLLLLEGYVDKDKYVCSKIADAEILGICSVNHKFAFKEVSLQEVLQEKIVLREKGSGTRNVFEMFLLKHGYSTDNIKHKSIISSNKIIENIVENNIAISFVYDIIQRKNPHIAYFKIKDTKILHEFNYVFLNNLKVQKIIDLINKKI
ncbi:MAG: LysR family transcriptional regulator [Spirochaetales bacterium]